MSIGIEIFYFELYNNLSNTNDPEGFKNGEK